jgi:hypothetical protein
MSEPMNPSWAFVRSYGAVHPKLSAEGEPLLFGEPIKIHDMLFGYYTVMKTPEYYIFTLVDVINPADRELIGKRTVVPLSYKMGVGDFEDVTPEKIM